MKINMNEMVTVRLTISGDQILKEYYDSMNLPEDYRNKGNLSGDHEFHLWELMKIFGHCFSMGMLSVPFVQNSIDVELKK